MKSFFLFFALFQIASFSIFAQKNTEKVLYLKNEWVIRGKVLSDDSEKIKIQTTQGNIFVFSKTDVLEIKEEKVFSNTSYKTKGFSHYTELGALAARNTANPNVNTSAFSFQTVNGYKFNQYLFLGGGIGIDLYATQTFLPVFGSIRGDFVKNKLVIPFYFLDIGYGKNITTNENPNLTFSGGALWGAGIGMKVIFNNSTGFLLSVGYRQQQGTENINMMNSTQEKSFNYQRIALRAGFSF
ncbi:hypothetical protein AD998_11520 [bacterium 336/3]|nr:hypothetical protein AD998_11520 [bacterium 336/3]